MWRDYSFSVLAMNFGTYTRTLCYTLYACADIWHRTQCAQYAAGQPARRQASASLRRRRLILHVSYDNKLNCRTYCRRMKFITTDFNKTKPTSAANRYDRQARRTTRVILTVDRYCNSSWLSRVNSDSHRFMFCCVKEKVSMFLITFMFNYSDIRLKIYIS